MLSNLQEFWKKLCTEGLHLPFAHDPESDKPSVTLGFYWIVAFLSIASLVLFHLKLVTIAATGMSLLFVLVGFIMYRLRKLDKVKIDIDDQSIELDGKDENETK